MIPLSDSTPRRRTPFVTWGLIAANVAVFWYALGLDEGQLTRVFYLFGVVPLRYTHPAWAEQVGFPALGPLPFLTSLFLHGGWLHLAVNMWTLWIFGDNVEDRMGRARFLAFYLIAGVGAGLVHLVFHTSSAVPVIGASGAIAGVLGAYFVLFPLARVVTVIPVFFYPLVIELPAFVYMLVWFWMQLLSGALALAEPEAGGGIAWWAHIGGFVVGMFLHRFFVKYPPAPPDRRRGAQRGREYVALPF